MTGNELPTILPESCGMDDNSVMFFIIGIAVAFTATTIYLMIRDYSLHLADYWNKRYKFADFVKREQFYIYVWAFFLLLFTIEVWVQGPW